MGDASTAACKRPTASPITLTHTRTAVESSPTPPEVDVAAPKKAAAAAVAYTGAAVSFPATSAVTSILPNALVPKASVLENRKPATPAKTANVATAVLTMSAAPTTSTRNLITTADAATPATARTPTISQITTGQPAAVVSIDDLNRPNVAIEAHGDPGSVCWEYFLELHKKFRRVIRKSDNGEHIHVHDLKLCLDLFAIETRGHPFHGLHISQVQNAMELNYAIKRMYIRTPAATLAELKSWQIFFKRREAERKGQKSESKGCSTRKCRLCGNGKKSTAQQPQATKLRLSQWQVDDLHLTPEQIEELGRSTSSGGQTCKKEGAPQRPKTKDLTHVQIEELFRARQPPDTKPTSPRDDSETGNSLAVAHAA